MNEPITLRATRITFSSPSSTPAPVPADATLSPAGEIPDDALDVLRAVFSDLPDLSWTRSGDVYRGSQTSIIVEIPAYASSDDLRRGALHVRGEAIRAFCRILS